MMKPPKQPKVFHLLTKIRLLEQITNHHLTENGYIIIGDIAFPSRGIREQAHKRWAKEWDEAEYYWAADEAMAACNRAGLQAEYSQVSACGGVFAIKPTLPKQAPPHNADQAGA